MPLIGLKAGGDWFDFDRKKTNRQCGRICTACVCQCHHKGNMQVTKCANDTVVNTADLLNWDSSTGLELEHAAQVDLLIQVLSQAHVLLEGFSAVLCSRLLQLGNGHGVIQVDLTLLACCPIPAESHHLLVETNHTFTQ